MQAFVQLTVIHVNRSLCTLYGSGGQAIIVFLSFTGYICVCDTIVVPTRNHFYLFRSENKAKDSKLEDWLTEKLNNIQIVTIRATVHTHTVYYSVDLVSAYKTLCLRPALAFMSCFVYIYILYKQ